MLPTNYQFERAKSLCLSLAEAGYAVSLKTIGNFKDQSPAITILASGKIYKFSDPNWDIVNKQLQQLVNLYVTS